MRPEPFFRRSRAACPIPRLFGRRCASRSPAFPPERQSRRCTSGCLPQRAWRCHAPSFVAALESHDRADTCAVRVMAQTVQHSTIAMRRTKCSRRLCNQLGASVLDRATVGELSRRRLRRRRASGKRGQQLRLQNAVKFSSLATKSVSELTSTMTALLPSAAITTRPSAATRPAFLSAFAWPDLRRAPRGIQIAAGFNERFLALHHASAGALAKLFNHRCSNRHLLPLTLFVSGLVVRLAISGASATFLAVFLAAFFAAFLAVFLGSLFGGLLGRLFSAAFAGASAAFASFTQALGFSWLRLSSWLSGFARLFFSWLRLRLLASSGSASAFCRVDVISRFRRIRLLRIVGYLFGRHLLDTAFFLAGLLPAFFLRPSIS